MIVAMVLLVLTQSSVNDDDGGDHNDNSVNDDSVNDDSVNDDSVDDGVSNDNSCLVMAVIMSIMIVIVVGMRNDTQENKEIIQE